MKDRHKKSPFPFRMDEDIEPWARGQAKANDRPVNWFLNKMLRKAMEQPEAQHEKQA